jgi:transposase
MPKKLYNVHLTNTERMSLQQTINQGKPSARKLTRARILLLADDQWKDVEIAQALKISSGTVQRIRQRYCQQGLETALKEKPRPGAPPKVDSRLDAQLTLLACSEPPAGQKRWTLRLLADKLVELELVGSMSHTTVHRQLKKTN